jgi:acyl carrier protein
MTDTVPAPPTADQLRGWLTERVGYYVERPAAEIDPATPLTDYGLDSVYAFALCGEIEDTWRIPVDPALIWDFDTIDGLVGQLSAKA